MRRIFSILIICFLITSCTSIRSSQNSFLAAAISTDNVDYVKLNDNISKKNLKKYISFALEADSLNSLEYLLESNKESLKDIKKINELLFEARSEKALYLLLKYNLKPDMLNSKGETYITYLLNENKINLLKLILSSNLTLNFETDKNGTSPIFKVLDLDDYNLLLLFIEKAADFTSLDEDANYPIYYTDNRKMVEQLLVYNYDLNHLNLRKENVLGEVLLKAKKNNWNNIIKKLVERGLNPSYTSYMGL